MGYYKETTVEVTFKGEKFRIAKQDKSEFDKLKSKKKTPKK